MFFALKKIKSYSSPLYNPNVGTRQYGTTSTTMNLDQPPELRLCRLLTWSNYDGYGFYTTYNTDGCFIRNVEPNSPAQLGGLRDYDRILEINGKPVSSRDRDFVVRQINKHKAAGSGKSTLKSQSAYSLAGGSAGGTTKSSKSMASSNSASTGGPGQNYLDILVADPNTYKWHIQRKIDMSSRNRSLRVQECCTPAENTIQQLMSAGSPQVTTTTTAITATTTTTTGNVAPSPASGADRSVIDTIRTNQSGVNTLNRATNDVPRNLIMKRCTIRRLKVYFY